MTYKQAKTLVPGSIVKLNRTGDLVNVIRTIDDKKIVMIVGIKHNDYRIPGEACYGWFYCSSEEVSIAKL